MNKIFNKLKYNSLLIIVSTIIIIPIYYLVITTFKTPEQAIKSPLGLPTYLNFNNYIKAFKAMNYFNSLKNNLIIVISSVILLIILSSMSAYVIARSRKKIFKIIYAIFLTGLIIPFQISIIPLYRILAKFNLINTHIGVILIDVFCINLPLSIFLMRGFINTVPKELEEAAIIDGCSTFTCFWKIVFPILKPIIATVAILNTLAIWNDFLTPLLFLQSPSKQVLLQQVYRNVGPFATNWTSFFPMLILATIPLITFYFIMQKQIIEGVAAGAIK